MSLIKLKSKNSNYSIFIGKNILNNLKKQISVTCPNTNKIALIVDKRIK